MGGQWVGGWARWVDSGWVDGLDGWTVGGWMG